MNKIIKTKVGDEIHYFVNGQENHGVVAKMSATYVTIFKEDGKFYQVPLDDTFFVKDILVNKTWDDMSMEEKTEQLQLIKAYSPRYLSKTWEQLPQELRDVLKRGAPQDISRLNLGDQKVTPQDIDDETTVYPDLTERKEEGKTQHADAMRRQSEKYREAHPEVKAPDETSQSPIKKEGGALPKPEVKPTKTLPQAPDMQSRTAQAESTVPHPDDESQKDKDAVYWLKEEGGVRGKSPLKKALELLDKIKDKPYPKGMRQTGTPNAPMVNMNVLENLEAQDKNRPPSNALPDKTKEMHVSQYYGRKKFKTREARDAFDKKVEETNNYPKKRGRKRQ